MRKTFADYVKEMTVEEYQSTIKVLLAFFGFAVYDKVKYKNEEWEITGATIASQYGKPVNALEVVIAKYRLQGNLMVQEKNKHLIFPKDLSKVEKLKN